MRNAASAPTRLKPTCNDATARNYAVAVLVRQWTKEQTAPALVRARVKPLKFVRGPRGVGLR